MDYKRIYDEIIANARNRKLNDFEYYERHHIIPRCNNGTDDKTNLVALTLREHYICHKLLAFIYPNNIGYLYAYWYMTVMTKARLNKINDNEIENIELNDTLVKRIIKTFNITSREYERARSAYLENCIYRKKGKVYDTHMKTISEATKTAMRQPDRIKKCRANRGTRYYRNIQTGEVRKWFPGDPDIDLSKYQWGRGSLTKEQKAKISKTQLLEKTICKIGDTNYRYCWYKDFIKTVPENFIDMHQKQSNSLKQIAPVVTKALGRLKDNNIFIDDFVVFRPYKAGLMIITPAVYELCLDEIKSGNVEKIAKSLHKNIDKIKELNKKYIKEDLLT